MNQILQIEYKDVRKPINIQKIVQFFAVSIGIFAVILIGLGSYYLIKNKQSEDEIKQQIARDSKYRYYKRRTKTTNKNRWKCCNFKNSL